ncbi:Myosin type-2 heavy chain 1 [Coemansia spiralis]|uniref:Myosin type-2 heavy chain 1 n=2 Tax=Coemansia TaxID=4863 RepID=A0A9W8GLU6_9FUNG|nr:Myosin type-2 heavy chain 1 [Coemansia spiralis]
MPLVVGADSDTIARALKILEPYTKGARAWFEDADEAWVKGTLVQRTDDSEIGVGRLVFVRDDSVGSPTAQFIAQTASPPAPPARQLAGTSSSDPTQPSTGGESPQPRTNNAGRRKMSVRAATTSDELKRIVARGSRLTGGRISSMQRVDDNYVIDIAFAELAEPGADSDLLPPLCNPPILDCTPDLTTLSYLHEPAVLYNLKRRYEQRMIYTYSGVVLVAMNPFDPVPLYSAEYMARYARKEPGHEVPHLFAIAENAYKGMVTDQRNQTIIVYGESGSGKTTSAKYIMRYFAQAHHADANDKEMSTVESQILATNPVFESFGNAKTTRNDNSSRFGKFLDIKFEQHRMHQKIVGGRIRTFLLERSRVAYQPPTERNYHIFYQLLAGAPDELRAELRLNGEHASWQAFHYTRQGGEGCGTIAGVNDAEDFAVTDASLGLVGIGDEQRAAIWRTLAGILHLGNVTFSGTESTGSYVDSSAEAEFGMAAGLLGVEEHRLRQWLTKRQIVTRHDHILAKVNKAQALVIRDSIAKFIYSRLFDWILGPINASLLPTSVDEKATRFVGVLDIYGFEHFDQNSFEQFCINYANEKLQQNFNHHVFKLEQEEYRREKLENWTFIGFQDNQPCIDLIEGKPIGILSLLDEESRLEQGSDRTFTEKLYRQFVDAGSTVASAGSKRVAGSTPAAVAAAAASAADVSYFRKPRFSNTAFTIRHYAHDVTYEGDGFLEKNKDTVPDEILELLCSSSFGFLGDLAMEASAAVAAAASAPVSASPRMGGGRVVGGGVLRRQAPTLAAVFRRSLSGLMATLAETEMHYIRCIKPNEAKAAWRLQAPMVLAQLRSCGVIETIRISKAGYPSRVPVRTFNERYAVLLNSGAAGRVMLGAAESQASDDRAPTRAEHQLCAQILELCLADRGQYQVGLTKVFFRAGQWAIMEKKRSSLFDSSAAAIQRLCRGALVRRSRARVVSAVVTVQRWFRSCCDKRLVASLLRRHAVRVIERAWAAKRAARRLQSVEAEAAVRVQALARAWLARRRVARMCDHRRTLRRAEDAARRDLLAASAAAAAAAAAASAASPSARGSAAPPMLRSESEAVSDAFARLTLSSPTTAVAPATPTISPASALASMGDARRLNSQASSAARQRTAEARASLLAAGVAERKAEAGLPPIGSAYGSAAVNQPTARNTFGMYSGSQLQQRPSADGGMRAATPAAASRHHKCDSLTIGEDIYAIINEFSLVAGGRYGEVDAREQLRSRELAREPPASRIPAPPGSSGRAWAHEAAQSDEAASVDSDSLTAASPGLNASIDSARQAPTYPMAMVVHRRGSRSNASAKSSLAELGGRHTAARARAWATKQKDRVFSAFGNGAGRRGGSSSSPDPRAALLMGPASPASPAFLNRSLDDHHRALDLPPPPALRLHHQSHSAANLHQHAGSAVRHASADSLR